MPLDNDNKKPRIGGIYAHYVLFVLVLVYIFNFIDRQILAILSNDIQRDLGTSDAQMGFLYGTVFALFYAVFGIPLGRFADVWVRRSLISLGLLFWSVMTALSGLARSFPVLALFRTGVGIGEASASPAAYSMLSDYYSPRLRATVIAIYSAGLYIGGGIGLFLGGFILDSWNSAYPVQADAPFGLKGWHVAFMAVGLPGILMALWVRTLKEPQRGVSEGLVSEAHPEPFKVLAEEMAAIIPLWSLPGLKRDGASLTKNAIAAVLIGLVAAALIWLTGSVAQWIAMGIGVYATFGWAQSLAVRDPATFAMIFRSRGMRYTMLAFPTIAFVGYGIGYWFAPLLLRIHDTNAGDVGMYAGLAVAAGGVLGVTLGGAAADWFKQRHPAGRMLLGYISAAGMVPLTFAMIYADSLVPACILFFFFNIFAAAWPGVPPGTAADLVLPRMRAVAGAYYLLMTTFIGLALGPYTIGQMSDVFAQSGMASDTALRTAMSCSLLTLLPTLVLLTLAWRAVPGDEATRLERARALGEELEV